MEKLTEKFKELIVDNIKMVEFFFFFLLNTFKFFYYLLVTHSKKIDIY